MHKRFTIDDDIKQSEIQAAFPCTISHTASTHVLWLIFIVSMSYYADEAENCWFESLSMESHSTLLSTLLVSLSYQHNERLYFGENVISSKWWLHKIDIRKAFRFVHTNCNFIPNNSIFRFPFDYSASYHILFLLRKAAEFRHSRILMWWRWQKKVLSHLLLKCF